MEVRRKLRQPPKSEVNPAGGEATQSPDLATLAIDTVLPMATSVPAHPAPPTKGPQYRTRSIVFTIYDLATLSDLRDYAKSECEYVRFGHEVCPTTGREHIQGWLQWSNPRSVASFWKRFNHPHIEPRYGNVSSNQDYTAKEGKWEEFGEPPKQGARTDWSRAHALLQRSSVAEVIADQPHLLPTIRALERFQQIAHQPTSRDVKTIYIHGPAGCGKTKAIYDTFGTSAYWKPNGEWFDGYNGEQVLVLDDYYGDLPYSQLLRVLDRYPLRVPIKGGFVAANWTTVLITSNARFADQYHAIPDTSALARRVHCVINGALGMSGKDITDALQSDPTPPKARVSQETHDYEADPTPPHTRRQRP